MTMTSALSERVFSHAGELHSAKRADLRVGIFAIPPAYKNESTFGLESNLIKVALICVNVILILILVLFMIFEIPLILILI